MYLKGRIRVLERKVQINKNETNQCATIAGKAKKDPDIPRREAKEHSGLVTQLHRRLDRLERLESAQSD